MTSFIVSFLKTLCPAFLVLFSRNSQDTPSTNCQEHEFSTHSFVTRLQAPLKGSSSEERKHLGMPHRGGLWFPPTYDSSYLASSSVPLTPPASDSVNPSSNSFVPPPMVRWQCPWEPVLFPSTTSVGTRWSVLPSTPWSQKASHSRDSPTERRYDCPWPLTRWVKDDNIIQELRHLLF